MNSVIEKNRTALNGLCKSFKVNKMYVFGSVLSDSFNENSDVDFLIKFSDTLSIEQYTDNYFKLHEQLNQLLNREIDLITERSLSNPYLIEKIKNTRQLIYED